MQENQTAPKHKHGQKSSELDKFKLFFEYVAPTKTKNVQTKPAETHTIRRRNV